MNFWEQFLLLQASSGLHAVILKYGTKYYTPEEQAVLAQAGDLLSQLPMRISTPR